MNTAIRIEHLSKVYRLGIINNGTLFRDIQTWIALRTGKEDPHSRIGENKFSGNEYFWALKDITLTIEQGDRIGIIGKNGAGKSTLLKILSKITAPTKGTIKIKGRTSSLLEVGTGFHRELTGRENIYLNGAILGMKRKQIDRKLDEIIDFSGIEHHIDTPVKRYSSGMYVRLAFAVAAYLDSDILIADEVLAVGDVEFQKKAIGKMRELSTGQGKTVLFVSHNLNAISSLCKSGLILDNGAIKYLGNDIQEVIAKYTETKSTNGRYMWTNDGFYHVNLTPLKFYLIDSFFNIINEVQRVNNNIYCVLDSEIEEINPLLNIGITVCNYNGEIVFNSWLKDNAKNLNLKKGRNTFYIRLPVEIMNIGAYEIILHAGLHHISYIIQPGTDDPSIQFFVTGALGIDFGEETRNGIIAPIIEWKNEL